MLAIPGGAAAVVAGDRDTDGLRWRKRAEVEVDPRSPAALIPLAERRESIILHLSFFCAATIWELATLSGPVGALTDEQALI